MTDTVAQKEKPVSFDLAGFERLAGDGDPGALPMLHQVLVHFEHGGDLAGTGSNEAAKNVVEMVCVRLATAISDLFASARLDIPLEDCDWLAFHGRHLAAIFRMAWPNGPERVFRRVLDAHEDAATGVGLRKVLAASSIAASNEIDWRDLLEREPETALPFFLANFSHRTLLDADAERRRDSLFALAPMAAEIPLRASTVPVLSEAWMLCSYAWAPDRHAFKHHLNSMVRELLTPIRPAELPDTRRREDRPTIVVIAEVLLSHHAMFKTYAYFLDQLRTRFHLVLVTIEGMIDEPAAALFDETAVFEWSAGLFKKIAEIINRLSPAIVYFPSAGMSPLTVLLCNLRLAPIQIVSTGHPATSQSPDIDYMVTGHEHFGGEEYFSEQVILLRSGGALFVTDVAATPIAPRVRGRPETLRVAVPASPMKLNTRFIDLCRRVAEKGGRAVEWWFFPNLTGLRHRDCRRQIEALLPGALVYPGLDYAAYLDHINRCDVRFGTYPFGGANTRLDAFRQGLPTLVLEGPEPHSRTDKRFIRLFGLPEWLIAGSEEEYEKAALRLIGDDEERCRLARQILDADPDRVLYAEEHDLYPTDFVDTFWWICENHERIKKSGKRAWTWEDRQAFDAG